MTREKIVTEPVEETIAKVVPNNRFVLQSGLNASWQAYLSHMNDAISDLDGIFLIWYVRALIHVNTATLRRGPSLHGLLDSHVNSDIYDVNRTF